MIKSELDLLKSNRIKAHAKFKFLKIKKNKNITNVDDL